MAGFSPIHPETSIPDAYADLHLFSYGGVLYLLNDERLYSVNVSDASLTRQGTITSLPTGDFGAYFTGAVAPVPEPAALAWALAALGTVGLCASRRSRLATAGLP